MSNATQRKPRRSEERRMLDEMEEMAQILDMHGVITKPDLVQIRSLCQKPPVFSPERVARIRKAKAHMSQSVFAALLNVSVSAVQKWEAPESGKHPSGAAAKLLQVIETKGIEAISL